jgi:hypothetical protein
MKTEQQRLPRFAVLIDADIGRIKLKAKAARR